MLQNVGLSCLPICRTCLRDPCSLVCSLSSRTYLPTASLMSEISPFWSMKLTGDVAPVTRRVQRKSAFFAGKEAHFKKMLDARVIQPSISVWALVPGLIRKKDRQVRWCLDIATLIKYRKQNVFPFPLIDECLDTLSGFSKLDANLALLQIKILALNWKKIVLWYSLSLCLWGLVCIMPLLHFQEPCQNLVLHGLTWRIDSVSFFG